MTYVPLDRRFIEWTDEKATAADASHWERSGLGRFDWPMLLERHRVVLLGEAGSGKSRELQEQTQRLTAEGAFAFFATVQAVAKDGLPGALSNQQRKQFEQWHQSDQTGYFFIDSFDEAKLDRVRLEIAYQKINDGWDGGQARAHIVLSGRYTDWQFQSDLARFEAALPVPKRDPVAELIAPDDLLRRALDNNVKPDKSEPPETTLVVITASLDRDQVRRYAVGRDLKNVDAFLSGIEVGNLWAFPTWFGDLVLAKSGEVARVLVREIHWELNLTDTVPQTAPDLQAVALRRVAAINHDLHHDDFAQGRTLKLLPNENEVQIWVANELKARAKRAYTVERESQVADGKMPDIRLRSRPASLPVEVKVAETWSIAELEEALNVQLTGRYLRHEDARHGVLLLVYQEKRRQGWQLPSGAWLSFAELVNHLKLIAANTAGQAHDAPKAEIAVIDVSNIEPSKSKSPSNA